MCVNGFTPTNSYNIKFKPKNEFHGAGLCDAFQTGEGLQQLPLLVKDMNRGRAFTLTLLLKCIVVNLNIFPTIRKRL